METIMAHQAPNNSTRTLFSDSKTFLSGSKTSLSDSTSPSSARTPRNAKSFLRNELSLQRRFHGNWWLEILALAIGAASQAAVFVILLFMHNRPLHLWTDRVASLTLNAAISVLSTTAKSLVLFAIAPCLGQLKWLYFRAEHPLRHLEHFDQAGKGPLGALQILGSVRMASACLGALVVLLSSAIDPFTQQVLVQYQRNVSLADPAVSFSTNNNYTSGTKMSYFQTMMGNLSLEVNQTNYNSPLADRM
jgi:hypothetical protein